MKRDYVLTSPLDSDGQPLSICKANWENNIGKTIDILSGICRGILADGAVSQEEAQFFANWVKSNVRWQIEWPLTDIVTRVNRVMADGKIDDEEREELKGIMETICGGIESPGTIQTLSTSLPLDAPLPARVTFPGKAFCITGKFAYGTRAKVVEALECRGARALTTPPTRETDYVVIGLFASRDWIHASYGRKIERAVELRESRTGIAIISEAHWRKFVDAATPAQKSLLL